MTKRRRWVKGILIALGVILALPIVVLALVLVALQFQPVRAAARDQGLALLKDTIKGKLELDDLRWPSLRHVELSGVRLYDRHGMLVANVGILSARIKIAPLLSGEVHLSEVTADGLYIDIGTPGTDHGLLSVFESDAPPEPEPVDQGPGLVVQIDQACLSGPDIRAQLDPQPAVALHRFSTCAMFRMAEAIELRLDHLRGTVQLNQQPAVAFIDEMQMREYDAQTPDATARTTEPAKAFVKGQLSLPEAGPVFDGRLELRGVNRTTFEAAGVEAEWLQGAADVSVAVDGDSAKMNYTVELRAPASKLQVKGDFEPNKGARARVWSEGLEPAKFTTIATEKIAFALAVNADLTRAEEPRISAKLESGSYGAWPLPVVTADAALAKNGTVTVPRFEARYPAGGVVGKATIGPGTALYAAIDAQLRELEKIPPLRSSLPGFRGQLGAKAEVRRAAESEELAIEAQVELRRLQADSPALAAERIDLKASASGPSDALAVKANISASELHFNDMRFAELQLAAHGGPELYQLQGQVDGDRGTVDAWVKTSEAGIEAGGRVAAKLPRGEAHATVERVLVAGNALSIEKLRAEHLGARVLADGSLGLAGKDSKLKLSARIDNLSALTHELAGSDVPGRLVLTADVTGALDQPTVDLVLDFRDGPKLAGAAAALGLRAKLDASRGQAQVSARGSAGKAVVQLALNSKWRRGAPLSAAIDGHHELDVNLERVSIADLVKQSDTTLPVPVAGTIAAKVEARGNMASLDLNTEVDARVKVGDEPNIDAKLTTKYGGGGLAVNAEVIDPHGNLLTVNWHQATRLERFTKEPLVMPEWLGQSDWEATVELASRRISELPTVRTQSLMKDLWPLRSELSVQLSHKAGAEPMGDVKMKASWDPERYDPRRADCSQRAKPSVELVGKLRDGLFVSELKGAAADKQMFSVKSQLGSHLEEWLEGRALQITKAQITASMEGFDLAQWPVTCEQVAGSLNARFSATDLFDKSAKFQAKLGGTGIVVGQSLPIDFDMQAQALPSGMDVLMRIDRIGGHAMIKGSVPVSVYVHDPATSVDPDGNLSLDVLLAKVDAKSLLAPIPAVARPSGTLDGRLKVFGTLARPRGSGSIQMNDVSLTLPNLGQRLTKVNGKVEIADNRVRIPELALRDQGGTAKFRAELELESTKAFNVDLSAKFDDFPVRNKGVLMGRADAAAKVNVKATEAQTDIEVRLSGVSVNLTGDTGADVQSLELHPEIVVAGETPPAEEAAEEEAEKKSAIINVYVRSDEPLWVRRDDFAIRMRADIGVHVANGTSQIMGDVKLERGYIALLGQQFDVKAGTVTFTGGQAVNPRLELTAESTSPSGKVVRVEVTGFVSAPQLAFFVSDQAVTAGEAITALTGRDSDATGSEESAEEQLASVAMGMTTGLLSLGARREFGDFIPMLSVEQDTDSTRVRAGFEADKLIPKFLRGFVRGAYVEGIVSTAGEGTRGSEESNGNAQAGVLVEFMLPSDLVWAGKYGPGQTWSLDLNWRP